MRFFRSYIGLILLLSFLHSCDTPRISIIPERKDYTAPSISNPETLPEKQNKIKPAGLPEVGKWMFDKKLNRAHWLGIPYQGKTLIEPINIIIIDEVSKTPTEALESLTNACRKAGFPARFGHSSGYYGYIAEKYFPQIPAEEDTAFSDAPAELPNNHGRIFGPFAGKMKYVFIGAFSRETISPSRIPHHFRSFNEARDRFAEMLTKKAAYHTAGFVLLDNYILNKASETTGDHDGIAVLIQRN